MGAEEDSVSTGTCRTTSAVPVHFSPLITIPPASSTHRSTIIFLHGRGQTAEYFHKSLLSTAVKGHKTFRDALPHAKFVFPTAPLMRATKYRRSLIHQWYDGSGDWEPEALGNMRDSVEYIHGLVREEIRVLGGDASKLVLAGFSQGCAMALTSFLLWEGDAFGAIVGMSGFMPLNSHMTELLEGAGLDDGDSADGFVFGSDSSSDPDEPLDQDSGADTPIRQAIKALKEEVELPDSASASPLSFLETPVFLGHGTEDPEVEYRHGHLSANLLEKMGINAQFHTYEKLQHCLSTDMLTDVASFLNNVVKFSSPESDPPTDNDSH